MIIDLYKYGAEVAAYVRAAEELVARASRYRLEAILNEFETGRETRRNFRWGTDSIRTIDATQYDRRTGANEPIVATIGFHASFIAPANRKSSDWMVEEMVTHLKIFRVGADEHPVMHLHVDKKNAGQLGPELHVQVSEHCTERLGMKLAVPRIPAGFLLPTDCLDFILSELFWSDWSKAQTSAHNFSAVRNAQLGRASGFAAAIHSAWTKSPRRTPISVLQDCNFEPALRLA
ncbi:hypothetical protein [Mesorhizobium sp. B2-4-6]|uniref:hypothetical protein n=1 Tax=Mesorhizobium sp. B2-4-6 TaxID=2589943 RepID=UPI00112BCBFB|nr:hypothetical protein [Mesorhizobium sp. B2-4-6]TPL49896.1 hypothetical protein FJ957_12640 [Mesorhizobium sp. B2-4-6]